MLEEITEPLLGWYDKNARVLPWREDASPYRVWVSEIMLQQTRVEAVKPFFERFIQVLPGIEDLACCPEDRLLKLWEGLGYYNRVKNMQKAAKLVADQYDGCMPGDYESLLKLPGIGPYTAGAVASIAFGIPVPAVDGNVLRVITRITASEADIASPAARREMEGLIRKVIPVERPGDFNQALMELGAVVCVPNGEAKCACCPLRHLCRARAEGRVEELPRKTPKKPRRIEERTVLVIRDGSRFAIRKRPKKGLLAGLYELPNLAGHLEEDAVLEEVRMKGLAPLYITRLPEAKHIFSHIEWRMIGYTVKVAQLEEEMAGDLIFVETEKTEREYPIPAAFAAYTNYLQIRLGQEKYQRSEQEEKQ